MSLIRLSLMISLLFATPLFAAAPSSDGFTTIMSILSTPVSFTTLTSEMQTSKVSAIIEKHTGEKFTLLAPTNKAFNDFGQIGALRGTPLYTDFLKFFILPGVWPRKRLRANRTAKTESGKPINTKDIGKILYSVETDNGIMHVIDTMVIHPDVKKKLGIK
jgi:hypothetical protein